MKVMENKQTKLKKIGYYGLPIVFLLMIILSVFHKTVWVDETYSLSIIKHSYTKLLQLASMDVHPPLYYMLLKLSVDIFGKILNPIYVGKLLSTIPYIIMMILGFTVIKKRYGELVSFLFNICVLGMPRMFEFATEIRMYSWGTLFIFCTFLFATNIRDNETLKDYIGLTIFATLASYIHYFACASAIVIYTILIVSVFLQKDYKKIGKIILSGIGVVILYLPWLFVFLKQFAHVRSGYWIQPIKWNDVVIDFLFLSRFNENWDYFSLSVLVISIVVIGIATILKNKNKDAVFALDVWFFTIVLGITLSLLIKPVYVARYIIPALGCMWLSMSIGLSQLNKKNKFRQTIILLTIVICLLCNCLYIKTENTETKKITKTFETIEPYINENTIIVTNHTHIQRVISYFYPNNEVVLAGDEIEDKDLTLQVYDTNLTEVTNLKTLKNHKSNILLIDATGDLTKLFEKGGYKTEKITKGNISTNIYYNMNYVNIE